MIKDHKIIASVFAGRRNRMSILIQYLKIAIDMKLIDEIHIWNYARNDTDKLWVKALSEDNIKVFDTTPNTKWKEYYQYYNSKNFDNNTVLLKIDDDIVYIDNDEFKKYIEFRIDNPQYFLVSPNIINNGVTAGLQQKYGIIPPEICAPNGFPYEPYYGRLWNSGRLAEQLHLYFLNNLDKFSINKIHIQPIGERISINFIAILGKDFNNIRDVYDDDEHLLSVAKSKALSRHNCVYLSFIVSHLSFYSQEWKMDTSKILQNYRDLSYDKHNILESKIKLIQNMNNHTIESYEKLICELGLNDDSLEQQSQSLHKYLGSGLYMWQYPNQLAKLSLFLHDKNISSYLEIGSYKCGTTIYLSELFRKNNPHIKIYACDTVEEPYIYKKYTNKYHNTRYYQMKSSSYEFRKDMVELKPEFVFIDGDHSYEAVKEDFMLFENISETRYILFHDICNDACRDVVNFWNEIKNNKLFDSHEFIDQYTDVKNPGKYLGLGLLIRK